MVSESLLDIESLNSIQHLNQYMYLGKGQCQMISLTSVCFHLSDIYTVFQNILLLSLAWTISKIKKKHDKKELFFFVLTGASTMWETFKVSSMTHWSHGTYWKKFLGPAYLVIRFKCFYYQTPIKPWAVSLLFVVWRPRSQNDYTSVIIHSK